MAIYNMMRVVTVEEKKEKLQEANRSLIFYVLFYGVLILIMCVLDFFRRIELRSMS